MDKSFYIRIWGLAIAVFSSSQATFFTLPSHANPVKDCVPVARSLESKKSYCAHELKGLKQEKARNGNAGILCFIVNKIIPLNQLLHLDQCVSKDAAYRFDAKGQRIVPKIKGATEKFAIIQPLGNTLITAQPDIAWQPIQNASYRVTLTQEGEWLWSHTTKSSSVKLPQALQPGKAYKINVAALINDQSVAEDSKVLQIADRELLRDIDRTVAQVHGNSRNELARGMDKALLLYHAKLLDAAAAQLKSLTLLQEPDVYQQLALIYQEAGQTELSNQFSSKAAELANKKNKPLSLH